MAFLLPLADNERTPFSFCASPAAKCPPFLFSFFPFVVCVSTPVNCKERRCVNEEQTHIVWKFLPVLCYGGKRKYWCWLFFSSTEERGTEVQYGWVSKSFNFPIVFSVLFLFFPPAASEGDGGHSSSSNSSRSAAPPPPAFILRPQSLPPSIPFPSSSSRRLRSHKLATTHLWRHTFSNTVSSHVIVAQYFLSPPHNIISSQTPRSATHYCCVHTRTRRRRKEDSRQFPSPTKHTRERW